MNLELIKKQMNDIMARDAFRGHVHLRHQDEGFEITGIDGPKLYIPTKTCDVFHKDDSLVRLLIGPYGSGKSTGCVTEIVKRACEMPVWDKGVRRSKWAVVRNTSGELYTTTLPTWLTWFQDLGNIEKRQKPVLTYLHQFNDDRGPVELEVLFLALDREDDLRKIRSLELTGVYINEVSESPQGILSHFQGRIDRYPAHPDCPDGYWTGIIADTNPPDTDHWIYRLFEVKPDPSYKIFHQPSGLLINDEGDYVTNLNADNIKHLGENYYLNMARGASQEFIKVFCMGEYGTVISGKRVYPEYNDDIHSISKLEPIEGLPIHLGWDFGLTPACVIVQFTSHGQILVLKEFVTEDMSLQSLYENIVSPYLSNHMAEHDIEFSAADPSGSRGMDTNDMSCIEMLNNYGIDTEGAQTNDPIIRIDCVKYFLNRMPSGKPGILISREGAPTIRKGFLGAYHYERIRVASEERYKDSPKKNFASHPHDALQYIAMKFSYDLVKGKERSSRTNYDDFITMPMRM